MPRVEKSLPWGYSRESRDQLQDNASTALGERGAGSSNSLKFQSRSSCDEPVTAPGCISSTIIKHTMRTCPQHTFQPRKNSARDSTPCKHLFQTQVNLSSPHFSTFLLFSPAESSGQPSVRCWLCLVLFCAGGSLQPHCTEKRRGTGPETSQGSAGNQRRCQW